MNMRWAVLVLLMAMFMPGLLMANPLDNYGIGSRWVAMGGAVTALVDDFASLYYNPAGLTHPRQVQASLSYFYADPTLKINGHDVGEDAVSGVMLGVATRPSKVGPFKMGGGVALHIPDKRVARSLAIPYDQPTFIQYGSRNQHMVIMTPVCVEVFPWLSLGGTISMNVDSSGGPDFRVREDREDNQGLGSEGSISTVQRPAFFFNAGIQVHPTENLHLGFCFRGKNEVFYETTLMVHIEPLHVFPQLPVPLLGESTVDMKDWIYTFFAPEQYSFGLGYDWGKNLTVALEMTYARWSSFRQPSPEGATYFFGGITVFVPPNPNYPLPPPDFSDIFIPAVGIEYRAHASLGWEAFVRAGYRYRPSPAASPSGWNNFLDNDTHIISGGLGISFLRVRETLLVLRGPIHLDFHCQYLFLAEERSKEINPMADAYGDLLYEGHVVNGGMTITLEF